MCHYADEHYAFYDEARTRARKPHACSACKEEIRPGDYYYRVRWFFDGEMGGVKRCLRCQALHIHIRRVSYKRADGELWPDERLACGTDYAEEWGGPPPPEVAALAFLTAGEAQAALDRKATEWGGT